MRGVSYFRAWLTAGLLTCAAVASATESAPPPAPAAQSALITLDVASAPAGLTLRFERTAGTAPLIVTAVTVSIDGNNMPATRSADGSWSAAWPRGGGPRGGRLEVLLSHDGIRELLSGALPAAAAGVVPGAAGGASLWRDHKQLAWWVLNIAVVLVAAIALSRRMS